MTASEQMTNAAVKPVSVPDCAIAMRRVLSDHGDVQRHGDEDQPRKSCGSAPDRDEEVVPLIRPEDVKHLHRSHILQHCTPRATSSRSHLVPTMRPWKAKVSP